MKHLAPTQKLLIREIPGELNRLIMQMIAKNRTDRPAIKEVYSQLEKILKTSGTSAS